MNELKATSVTDAIIKKLIELFPGIAIYEEAITTLRYPHFFIFNLSTDTEEDNYNRYYVNYLINIRYRVAAQPQFVTTLQKDLDTVAMELLSNLELVELDGWKYRIKNARAEKIDGILQYYCNLSVRVKKALPDEPKQEYLETNTQVKEN